jgi:transposase
MSALSITPYFPFRRIRILSQQVYSSCKKALLRVEPDRRFTPICHVCGCRCRQIHSWRRRLIRDLDLGETRVTILTTFRRLRCGCCGSVRTEDLELFTPYQRVTKRLARHIHDLCKRLTVKEVADHLGLDWKTVKEVDKRFLEEEFPQTVYEELRILAVDEISIKKRRQYLTVVLDFITGRVVWLGMGNNAETLSRFFQGMTDEQKQRLEAVAMDMWPSYIKAVKDAVPHVKIVFDLFHVVSAFNQIIDRVRIQEYQKACDQHKDVYKGTKYLLLKNREKFKSQNQHERLARLLDLNATISTVMILKDDLKRIWRCRDREEAADSLHSWYVMARASLVPEVKEFAHMLKRHEDGILNHCDYPIHTSKLEGVNNKIKVIKRKAYGFHDIRYFSLKVIQAFSCN